ncbi:DUF397 domain-containing protein [Thermomonospora catenispora]|uniref:DUF397 domain-containing protein n=1 Tax=Thermomonospora catenispora TaxID=2493090 RepID=UPI001121EC71|nr:DUF397 domain-containing protein [Thermomonospora catenispora]TNY36696.1 DUF397 domain-containing protein [Thermomonospora catenispora]
MHALKRPKGSKSDISGGERVEVAALPHGIGVRDGKNTEVGRLTVTRDAFGALVHRIERDHRA